MATARNRFYSSPPETHALGFMYGWSPTDVAPNGLNPNTGLWNPVQIDSSGYLQATLQPSAISYQTIVTGSTSGQLSIPVGAYNWNVIVQSGTAYLNSFPIFVGTVADGGNGIGGKLSAPLSVGISGGRVLVTYDI